MARNRMIKKEFWEDDKIAECSPIARLLFIALWNISDDEGFLEYRPKWIKVKCLPYDDVDLVKLLSELEESKRIVIKNNIICIPTFLKHQKIDRPQPSNLCDIFKGSANNRRSLDDHSPPNKKKVNKKKEKEEKVSSPQKYKKNTEEFRLSKLLMEKITENNPTHSFLNLNEKNQEDFIQKKSDIVRLMVEKDKRTFDQIEFLISWSQHDNFWKTNILSMEKLRKQFDTLVIQCKTQVKPNNKNNSFIGTP